MTLCGIVASASDADGFGAYPARRLTQRPARHAPRHRSPDRTDSSRGRGDLAGGGADLDRKRGFELGDHALERGSLPERHLPPGALVEERYGGGRVRRHGLGPRVRRGGHGLQ